MQACYSNGVQAAKGMTVMTKSQRMKPLTRVATSRERAAARELGEYRRTLAAAEAKYAELVTYREEYSQHLRKSGGAGIDAQRMRDYRLFLARLNEAIGHQQASVDQHRREYERKRRLWSEARVRSKALDKVVERYRHEEDATAERREQAESDERSIQQHTPLGKKDTE
jgi:flagellar FliJ protein